MTEIGTVQYALSSNNDVNDDNENWVTSYAILGRADAGTYYLKIKIVGDANFEGPVIFCLTGDEIKISPAQKNDILVEGFAPLSFMYSGEGQSLAYGALSVKFASSRFSLASQVSAQYCYAKKTDAVPTVDADWTDFDSAKVTDVGEYILYVYLTANNSNIDTQTPLIYPLFADSNPASITRVLSEYIKIVTPIFAEGLAYEGSAQQLIVFGAGLIMTNGSEIKGRLGTATYYISSNQDFDDSAPCSTYLDVKGTNAGDYYISGKVVDGGYFDGVYCFTLDDVELTELDNLNLTHKVNGECYVQPFIVSNQPVVYVGDRVSFCGTYNFTYDDYLQESPLNAESSVAFISCNGELQVENGSGIKYNILKTSLNQLSNNMDTEESTIAYAMLFGNKTFVPKFLKTAYSRTGLSHILAVSGLHVGLIIMMLGFLLKKLIKNDWVYLIVLVSILIGYAYLCSWSPSIIRAIVMCAVILIAKASYCQYDGLNALAIAGIINFIISPLNIFNIGFLLSFMVVFSIFSISPKILRILKNKMPEKIANSLSLSVSAWLGGIPIILFYFNLLSVFAIVINFVVVPLVSIIFITLIICLLLSLIPSFAGIFLNIPKIMLQGLNGINKIYGSLDGSAVQVNESYLLLLLGTIIIIFAGDYIFAKRKLAYSTTMICGLIASFLVFNAV